MLGDDKSLRAAAMSLLSVEWADGPKMQAVRKTVYSLPAVQGYYASLEKVNDYQKFLMDVSKC